MTPVVQTGKATGNSNVLQGYIYDSLHQATRAVHLLIRDGFSIERVELGGGGKPRIRIGWHPRVSNLGEIRVFSRGNNGIQHETHMVDFEHCQVSWIRK